MAIIGEESICYRHGWVGEGECPDCHAAAQASKDAYEERWKAMTTDQKIEELRRRIDGRGEAG